jgi:hypothetical protein
LQRRAFPQGVNERLLATDVVAEAGEVELSNTQCRIFHRVGAALVLGWATILAAGCSSTIHKEAVIGGVDTLSVDAKQRLVLVGDRSPNGKDIEVGSVPPQQVECTEPSPDAIVAQAAALAAGVDLNGGSGNASGGGGIGAGFSESAASIGFRDHTVQMMRDAYYRMCEAYLNGAISERAYRNMVLNADTFMVVASALQTLGTNPVASPVAISAASELDAGVDAKAGAASVTVKSAQVNLGDSNGETALTLAIKNNSTSETISAENAKAATQIIKDYLRYREALGRASRRADKADERKAAYGARY